MTNLLLPPRWQNFRSLNKRELSSQQLTWLLDSGSMTAKLRKKDEKHFTLRLLQQTWQQPRFDEKEILELQQHEIAVVREVELICNERVCIAARSIFPQQTLKDKGALLHTLGERPLIEVLLKDPNLKRSDFEFALLQKNHLDYQRAVRTLKNPPDTLWSRRSIFYFFGNPLLVSEVFLPEVFVDYPVG